MPTARPSKKQVEALEAEIRALRIIAAFRLTPEVPPDLPIPKGHSSSVDGWEVLGDRVRASWSDSVSHGSRPRHPHSGSQQGIQQYSTKALALAALRHKVAMQCAAKLLQIDMEAAESE